MRAAAILFTLLWMSSSFAQTVDQAPVEVTIRCEDHQLQGHFFVNSSSGISPTIILCKGFPSGDEDVLGLGRHLSRGVANALTFNYSGAFRSEGVFSMENALKDIQAACDFVRRRDIASRFRVDTSRIILGGHSFGGGMALAYAATHPEIRRLLSLAGNDHGEFAREYSRNAGMARALDSIFDKLRSPNGPIRFTGSEALKELEAHPEQYDLRLHASLLADRDILIIGGWDDLQVSVEHNLVPLYRALKAAHASAVRIVMFPADHVFRNVRDDLAAEIIQWIQKEPGEKK